uniref:Uncharacterized protein n=1 Tax=Anguilla anguilla TaxID=7936 RepID=A0A0E9QJ37_ANGAN
MPVQQIRFLPVVSLSPSTVR